MAHSTDLLTFQRKYKFTSRLACDTRAGYTGKNRICDVYVLLLDILAVYIGLILNASAILRGFNVLLPRINFYGALDENCTYQIGEQSV